MRMALLAPLPVGIVVPAMAVKPMSRFQLMLSFFSRPKEMASSPRKSWQNDRQQCLMIFERARYIIATFQLHTAKAIDLKAIVEKKYEPAQDTTQVDCSESETACSKPRSRNVPCRMIAVFGVMLFVTVFSGACCMVIAQRFPIGGRLSSAADFLITIICTTAAFLVIARFWTRREAYTKFIHYVLGNLTELPALYCPPKIDSETVTLEPGQSVRIFTMQPLKHHAWTRTMQSHTRFAVLMSFYCVFISFHLLFGSANVLNGYQDCGLAMCLFITAGFSLQAIFFVLYPLVNYAYMTFCIVLTVQSEHLNQFIRNLKARCGHNRLPLKEELDLVRVWYARVGRCVLHFDRFGHIIFFQLYLAQIGAMMVKSIQVHLIFEQQTFTFESYVHLVELGFLCFGTILHMQLVYNLNKSISKPNHYIAELGLHSALNEPFAFTEYLQFIGPRFYPKSYQLTFLRIMPIGKEFFMITSFFIVSAVASYGSFGTVFMEFTHQLHLLI